MAGGIFMEWTGNLSPDCRIVFEATRQMSQGVAFVSESEYRYIADSDGDDVNPIDLTTQYTAVFGEMQSGQKIFGRAYAINKPGYGTEGLTSDRIEALAQVDA